MAVDADLSQMEPGDAVQISFDGQHFSHTPVIVSVRRPVRSPADLLVAAHSYDADNRPLDTYPYQRLRFLHFLGVRRGEEVTPEPPFLTDDASFSRSFS